MGLGTGSKRGQFAPGPIDSLDNINSGTQDNPARTGTLNEGPPRTPPYIDRLPDNSHGDTSRPTDQEIRGSGRRMGRTTSTTGTHMGRSTGITETSMPTTEITLPYHQEMKIGIGKKTYLCVEYLNVRSLLCRKNDIEVILNDSDIDILCLTETWLLSNISLALTEIPKYNIFRCDKGKGGGCCIYVRNDLSVNICNLNVPMVDGLEDIWLSVQHRKFPSIIIGCLYRHPSASNDTFNHILERLRLICLRNKKIYIVGDLNSNLLDKSAKLHNIIKITKLVQLIDKPTRITPTSSTLIDVLITNKKETVLKVEVNPNIIADHEHISFLINIKKA